MPKTSSAATAAKISTITITEPCLRMILIRFSKKLTNGFVIIAMTHAMMIGKKNRNSFGPKKKTASSAARVTSKLTTIR